MIPILLGQVALPALLAVWILARPPRSAVGFATQVAGSLLGLAALARFGLWLFPPWWLPHAAAIVIVLAAALQVRRRAWTSGQPRTGLGWAGVALFSGVGVAGALLLVQARAAARMPAAPAAFDLHFPLAAGRYLVVNGGGALMLNAHRESLDTSIVRLRPWRGNGHAVDIVATNLVGMRAPGLLPTDPAVYRIFGMPVVAPCAGAVIVAVDGLPDMPVPEYDRANMAGNHVILDCAGVHVVLAHLQRRTVRVHVGEWVEVGSILGAVGNSGGTSEPHLHIHAQRPGPPGAPMAGDPLPMRLGGRYLVRGDRVKIPSAAPGDRH